MTLQHFPGFSSQQVLDRQVDVWLPSAYDQDPDTRHPVLYAHDGQNLFQPETAYTGVDWGLCETIPALIKDQTIQAPIVVGIWNTKRRVREYAPTRILHGSSAFSLKHTWRRVTRGKPLGDLYLRFLIQELKPWIDSHFRTQPDPSATFLMGSSMGGLISLYGLCEYPGVFGGAACLSTHWPFVGDRTLSYLQETLPEPGTHRIYFDHGTETLDAQYGEYQQRVNTVFHQKGYRPEKDWMTRVFPGHDHSESAWRKRVHIPLSFLLK